MLAKTRLDILIVPDRAQHEVYALRLGACEQQDSVADHAVAQQSRGVVQEDEVEPIARSLAAERAGQTPDRVLDRRGARCVSGVEQHRDVDVALAVRDPSSSASVQPREAHGRVRAQAASETAAKTPEVSIVSRPDHDLPIRAEAVATRSFGPPIRRTHHTTPRRPAVRRHARRSSSPAGKPLPFRDPTVRRRPWRTRTFSS